MKKCNVAVIGLGKMGLLHTSILSAIPNVRLISVCDQKKTITKIAKKFLPRTIKVVNDIDLLSAFDIDAIFVTTPISTHFRVCQEIYRKKIASNIFIEKTLAAGLPESEQLCETAKQSGGLNAVGYQKRYCVTYRKARELFNEDTIGTVQKFKAYSYSSDFLNLTQESLMKTSMARGGVLRDLGAHALDLASWFFGDITPTAPPEISDAACVSFFVKDSKNRCGQVETSWTKEGYRLPETGLVIEGSKGTLLVNDDKVEFKSQGLAKKWYRQDLADNVDFLLWAPEYYRQDLHFVQRIMNIEYRFLDSISDFSQASKVDKIISQVLSE